MVDIGKIEFLVVQVASLSSDKPQLVGFYLKNLHRVIQGCTPSQKRTVLMIATKLKNQGKIQTSKFELLETYIKQSMSKSPPSCLNLGYSLDTNLVQSYQILNLFKFDKLIIKRKNFAFTKIYDYFFSINSLHHSKAIKKLLKIHSIYFRKQLKKAVEKLRQLAIFKNFRYESKKTKIFEMVVNRLILSSRCFDIHVCIWKLKILADISKKLSEKGMFLQHYLLNGAFGHIKSFFMIVKRIFNISKTLNNLIMRSSLRLIMTLKTNFLLWKIFFINQKIYSTNFSLNSQKVLHTHSSAIQVFSVFCKARFLRIVKEFYIKGLKVAEIKEVKISRIKRRRVRVSIKLKKEFLKHERTKNFQSYESFFKSLDRLSIRIFYINQKYFDYLKSKNPSDKIDDERKISENEKLLKSIVSKSFYLQNQGKQKLINNFTRTRVKSQEDNDKLGKLVNYMANLTKARQNAPVLLLKTWENKVNYLDIQKNLKLLKVFGSFKCKSRVNSKLRSLKIYENFIRVQKNYLNDYFRSIMIKSKNYSQRILIEKIDLILSDYNKRLSLFSFKQIEKVGFEEKFNYEKFCLLRIFRHLSRFIKVYVWKRLIVHVKISKFLIKTIKKLRSNDRKSLLIKTYINEWRSAVKLSKTKENLIKLKALNFTSKLKKIVLHQQIIQTKYLKNFSSNSCIRSFKLLSSIYLKNIQTFFNRIIRSSLKNKNKFSSNCLKSNLKSVFNILTLKLRSAFSSIQQFIYLSSYSSKLKSTLKIVSFLSKSKTLLETQSLQIWKNYSKIRNIFKHFILQLIKNTSLSYWTGFHRWKLAIKTRYNKLHLKYYSLIIRLDKLFINKSNFYKHFALSSLNTFNGNLGFGGSINEKSRSLTKDLDESCLTNDKSINSALLSPRTNKENCVKGDKLIFLLAAAQVFCKSIEKFIAKKEIFAICAIKFCDRNKINESLKDLKDKKNVLRQDKKVGIWENLDLKLRKKCIGREIKKEKKNMNFLIEKLKILRINGLTNILQSKYRKQNRESLALIKLYSTR